MEFLNNAIVSSEDGSILGVLLTEFDPSVYTSRAVVKLYTVEDLTAEYDKLSPRGFKFTPPGTLLSDTSVTRAVANSVFSYMEEECGRLGQRSLDITDLVLLGMKDGGCVFANYEELVENGSKELMEQNAVLIPFKNFKVSNSSFNIYAPYQVSETEGFRTFSLLEVEDGSPRMFHAIFPVSSNLTGFEGVTPCETLTMETGEFIVYKVELGLNGFYAGVGEAFLNFLAYNVSFCNIGEKLMKEMKTVMPAVPPIPTEDYAPRIPRRARVNVSIEHVYKDSRLRGIMGKTGDPDGLVEFLREFPEAAISYQWLQRIYNSPWYKSGEGVMTEEECIYTACTNLLSECRQSRLKYAIELLTHRYYIYMLGVVNDNLGPVLKGGGVSGQSLKRVSF